MTVWEQPLEWVENRTSYSRRGGQTDGEESKEMSQGEETTRDVRPETDYLV